MSARNTTRDRKAGVFAYRKGARVFLVLVQSVYRKGMLFVVCGFVFGLRLFFCYLDWFFRTAVWDTDSGHGRISTATGEARPVLVMAEAEAEGLFCFFPGHCPRDMTWRRSDMPGWDTIAG